jgi:hypothetical protein
MAVEKLAVCTRIFRNVCKFRTALLEAQTAVHIENINSNVINKHRP